MLSETKFPVKEIPAIGIPQSVGDEVQFGQEIDNTGYKFIVREDTGDILSCMTDEYKLVTNTEILDTAVPIFNKVGAKLREAKVLQDGKKTIWKYSIPGIKVPIADGDEVSPEIVIKNSYDGSWELGVISGAFRLICENGMVIGIILNKKSNRHSIYNPRLENLEELIVDTIEKTSTVFEQDFAILKDTKVSQSHVKKMVEMIPTNVMDGFVQYLCAHKPHTYWDLFNAATWVNTHHMNRNNTTTHKFEHQIYPTISKWANTAAQA